MLFFVFHVIIKLLSDREGEDQRMNKKLFRQILILISVSVLLVAVIVKFDWIFSVLNAVLTILAPLFIGIGVAFVLYPLQSFLQKKMIALAEKRALKKQNKPAKTRKKLISPEMEEKLARVNAYRKKQKQKRKTERRPNLGSLAGSLVATYLILAIGIGVVFLLLIPQLGDSVSILAGNMKTYMANLKDLFNRLAEILHVEETLYSSIENLINTIIANLSQIITGVVPKLFDLTKNVALVVSNIVIGLIMSVYILVDRERLVKRCSEFFSAIMSEKIYAGSAKVVNLSAKIFSGYIRSRFVDSIIIGILCYICMLILGFDYPLLISVLVGITNVIPVFGPFMGAIPSAFILLMIDPMEAVWFSVFILILQQIDGNIIGPKVTGDSVGLPVLWTMIAILVGGGLFGVIGMLLGVPTVAVFYYLLSESTEKRLKKNEEKIEQKE